MQVSLIAASFTSVAPVRVLVWLSVVVVVVVIACCWRSTPNCTDAGPDLLQLVLVVFFH